VRQRSGSAHSRSRLLRRLLAATLLAGAVVSVNALAADVAAKPASSCVACHTDSAKLQEEAKGLPVPAASALQAGKG
jgi:cytochrome c553